MDDNDKQIENLTGLINAEQLQDIMAVYAAVIRKKADATRLCGTTSDTTEYPDYFY